MVRPSVFHSYHSKLRGIFLDALSFFSLTPSISISFFIYVFVLRPYITPRQQRARFVSSQLFFKNADQPTDVIVVVFVRFFSQLFNSSFFRSAVSTPLVLYSIRLLLPPASGYHSRHTGFLKFFLNEFLTKYFPLVWCSTFTLLTF